MTISFSREWDEGECVAGNNWIYSQDQLPAAERFASCQ